MVLGSYAAYVWSAYAISFVALAATAAATLLKWRRAKRRLESLKDSATNI